MRSSIVATVVLVLGLSATVYSQASGDCNTKCEVVKNGTVEWENGVQIQYGSDVTITVSRKENVIVFVNQKSQLVIVYDLKASLVLIYRFNASFGLAINVKRWGVAKVTLDINLVINGDFTALRESLDKANTEINTGGSSVIKFNFTYIQSVTFDFSAVFSGSATVVAEFQATYEVVFVAVFNAAGVAGRGINFAGVLVIAVIGRSTDIAIGIGTSISLVVDAGVQISYTFASFLVTGVQQTTSTIYLTFQASFKAAQGNLDKAIAEIRNGVNFDTQFSIGSTNVRVVVVLVSEYLEFALKYGTSINVDIGYSGGALAIYNARANIVLVLYRSYVFIYSYELKAGFLIKGSQGVYVSSETIQTSLDGKAVNSGTLAVFISSKAETVFSSGKKFELKDLRAALESESKFEAFAQANGIANAKVAYKVLSAYRESITVGILGLGGGTFKVSTSIQVTFSLDASYKSSTSFFGSVILSGISNALAAASASGVAASNLFGSLQGVFKISGGIGGSISGGGGGSGSAGGEGSAGGSGEGSAGGSGEGSAGGSGEGSAGGSGEGSAGGSGEGSAGGSGGISVGGGGSGGGSGEGSAGGSGEGSAGGSGEGSAGGSGGISVGGGGSGGGSYSGSGGFSIGK